MSCRNHSIKVSDATWSFWQGVARSKGLSVTKAIGEAMRLFGSDSSFAPVSLKDAVAEVKAQACGRSKPMPEAVFIVKDSNVHAVPKPPADPLPAQRSKLDEMRERQAKAFLKKGGK